MNKPFFYQLRLGALLWLGAMCLTYGANYPVPEGAYDKPWPKAAGSAGNYEVKTISEEPGEFVYETPHFRFHSNVKLTNALIKKASLVFEATYEATKALPWGNLSSRDLGDHKFDAYLFETKDQYIEAGGSFGSAGIQITKPGDYFGTILVPLESLGVRKAGKAYTAELGGDYSTLSHEITHQMMANEAKRDGWFIEATAEYVGQTPYKNGKFNFNNNKKAILEYVIGYGKDNDGGRALGKEIHTPFSLEEFMVADYGAYSKWPSQLRYGLALLLGYYFAEEDSNRFIAYIEALQKGESLVDAREKLLDGRTWEELEKEFTRFLKRYGVKITFGEQGGDIFTTDKKSKK